MLSLLIQGLRFNVRAAALIIDEGHLLLHRVVNDDFWTLPGGRVEPGEAALDTVVRELCEETGEIVTCGPLAFIAENFFTLDGVPAHEIGFYAHATLPGGSRLRDKGMSHRGAEPGAQLEYRWFPLNGLDRLALYPEFLRSEPLDRMQALRHVTQGEPPRSPTAQPIACP